MSKVVIVCPECQRQSNVPDDERLLQITCPHCNETFRVQRGGVINHAFTDKSTKQIENLIPMPGVGLLSAILFFGAITGILTSSYYLIGSKSLITVLLWVPLALCVLFFVVGFLLDVVLSRYPHILRQANSAMLFLCVALFSHVAWYASDYDDSQLERPVVLIHEWLGMEHVRSDQASELTLKARDALLEGNYLDANTHLSSLSRLYPSKPDRFYYYHAFVLHKLGEQVGADVNARRYLDRIGAEGGDFSAAHTEYMERLAL